VAFRWTAEDKILIFHNEIVKEIQDHGLSGPIANEIAPYAQLRVIHEDGEQRSPDESMNGMVPGSPNKEVMKKLYMPDCTLGTVRANDGQGCYVIRGPRAHVMSSVAVGLWYDEMINRMASKEDMDLWNESKNCSHMLALGHLDRFYHRRFEVLKEHREHLIRKFDSMYGPQRKGEIILGNPKSIA
jgi:hypothetical protein